MSTPKVYTWAIPSVVSEYRDVCVEAVTQTEAMQKYRDREWVEGGDPDDTKSGVRKVGKIRRLKEAKP